MKKFFALIAIIGMFTFGATSAYADQEIDEPTEVVTENAEGDTSAVTEEPVAEEVVEAPVEEVAAPPAKEDPIVVSFKAFT